MPQGKRNIQSNLFSLILGLIIYYFLSPLVSTYGGPGQYVDGGGGRDSNHRVARETLPRSNLRRAPEDDAFHEITNATFKKGLAKINTPVKAGIQRNVQKDHVGNELGKEAPKFKQYVDISETNSRREKLQELEKSFSNQINAFVDKQEKKAALRKHILEGLDSLDEKHGDKEVDSNEQDLDASDQAARFGQIKGMGQELQQKPYWYLKANDTIINTFDHKYLLSSDAVCRPKNGTNVHTLIIVASKPTALKARQTLRKTWGSVKYVGKERVETIYVVGSSPDPLIKQILHTESRNYGDILQIDFKDTYFNLTLKSIMAMKWATEYCSSAKFFMKTDHDSYVTVPNLVKYLTSLSYERQQNLYAGQLFHDTPVFRQGHTFGSYYDKFVVPYDEYPYNTYPAYCSGAGYVLSSSVAKTIVYEAAFIDLFRFEDVYIGMCANRSGFEGTMGQGFSSEWTLYTFCRSKYHIVSHYHDDDEIRGMWNFPKTHKKIGVQCPTRASLDQYREYDDTEVATHVQEMEKSERTLKKIRSLRKVISNLDIDTY